jgi:hypothetical protein
MTIAELVDLRQKIETAWASEKNDPHEASILMILAVVIDHLLDYRLRHKNLLAERQGPQK